MPRTQVSFSIDVLIDIAVASTAGLVSQASRVLNTELTALGFTGSVQTICRWLHPLRAAVPATARPIGPAVPKPRRITRWIMTAPHHLTGDDRAQLASVFAGCPELKAVADHVRDFADLMNKRRGDRLPDWMLRVQADNLPACTLWSLAYAATLTRLSPA